MQLDSAINHIETINRILNKRKQPKEEDIVASKVLLELLQEDTQNSKKYSQQIEQENKRLKLISTAQEQKCLYLRKLLQKTPDKVLFLEINIYFSCIIYYSGQVGVWTIIINSFDCASLCLYVYVREHISGTARPIVTKFCVHIPYGRVSIVSRFPRYHDSFVYILNMHVQFTFLVINLLAASLCQVTFVYRLNGVCTCAISIATL